MPSENFDRRGRAQTKQWDRSIRGRNCFIFRVQSIRVPSPLPGSNGSPTKKTMRIEKRWFHVTIVHERSNDYPPMFHIVRNRRTLDWLHLMKNRPATWPILITTVIRVAFRFVKWWKGELIRLDACFAWRIGVEYVRLLLLWRNARIRVKLCGMLSPECIEVFIWRRFDDQMLFSCLKFIAKVQWKIVRYNSIENISDFWFHLMNSLYIFVSRVFLIFHCIIFPLKIFKKQREDIVQTHFSHTSSFISQRIRKWVLLSIPFSILYIHFALLNISIAKSNKRTWSRAFFPVAQSRGNSYRDKIGKFTEKRLLNVSWNFNLRCSEVIKQAAWDAALKTAADKGKASKKLALFQEMHASNFTWTVIYPITLTKWIVIPWIREVLLVR